MKKILLSVLLIAFSSSAFATVNPMECGYLHGLVTGAQALGPTEVDRSLNVHAWVSIYELNETKFRIFNEGLQKNANLLTSPNIRRAVQGVSRSIQAIVDAPTRSGDANYWVSMVEVQERQFRGVIENLRLVRDQACERSLSSEGL